MMEESEAPSVRVVIVDDHPVVRAGLLGMLGGEPGIEVVGEAGDGVAAVALAERLRPEVVLMDLRMPGGDGVTATERIVGRIAGVRVLVLTTYDSDADILRAIEAGATGYLLKDTPRDELFRAIRAAAQGRPVLAPTVASRLMERSRGPIEEPVSGREREVLRLVARGASNREVARALFVSEATIKSHLINVYRKLGVADRTSAVTAALQRGLIELGDGTG